MESSKFEPEVYPLHVLLVVPEENFTGGKLGKIRAFDKDPHDQLYYRINEESSHQSHAKFEVIAKTGELFSRSSLDKEPLMLI